MDLKITQKSLENDDEFSSLTLTWNLPMKQVNYLYFSCLGYSRKLNKHLQAEKGILLLLLVFSWIHVFFFFFS